MNNEDQRNKSNDNKKNNSIDEEELKELIREVLCEDFGMCSIDQKIELLDKPKHYTGIIGSNHFEEITEEEFNRRSKSKQ